MTISKEQAIEIKKQLLKQVESMPNENKAQIKEYIKGLDEQGLEEFLKQNKIDISEDKTRQQDTSKSEKPIFQSIIEGEIPSYKVAENNKAIAILELNPLSKGHSIILPKQKVPTEKIPKSAMTLAQKIAKKIKTKFKPEDIKIETSSFQEYPMINIIPIYKDKELKKEKGNEKELKKIQSKLETKKRSPRTKKTQTITKSTNIPEINFRIP